MSDVDHARKYSEETSDMQTQSNTNVHNLSDRKLWEILRLAELRNVRVAPVLLQNAREELHRRGQHSPARCFNAPR
jgi:hypothetical protein